MQETVIAFHQVEWPAAGARVAGPVVWLRGWVHGKAGFHFTDVRVSSPTGLHLGLLGLPRTDLVAHFKPDRRWLPSGFIVGVPLPDGICELTIEAMDEAGNWHALQTLPLTVAADGARSERIEGELITHAGGTSTTRAPHLPFHGHIDQPSNAVKNGQLALFGWLLHESQSLHAVFATLDSLVFNIIESGLTDESLAAKVPQHASARQARLRGQIDTSPTITNPACLRVYAELSDGSVHLCFARRLALQTEMFPQITPTTLTQVAPKIVLPSLASGRPRRLLFVVRTLQPDDATWRALDVARHLVATGRWVVRLIAAADGPLHETFESAECPVQLVNPAACFAATGPSETAVALRSLSREIWWRHLDGVVLFDPAANWAEQLARQQGIPVYADPAEAMAWFAPSPEFYPDAAGSVVAPIRGQSEQGAGVLLHASSYLARHHSAILSGRNLVVTATHNTVNELLFEQSLAMQPGTCLKVGPMPSAVATVVCPAFGGHPHRSLLSALAAGIPLVATASPLLCATFGVNEINYVPAGNPLALAHAIVDTLVNHSAANRRAAAAQRIVLAEHSPAVQLSRWQALLEGVIQA